MVQPPRLSMVQQAAGSIDACTAAREVPNRGVLAWINHRQAGLCGASHSATAVWLGIDACVGQWAQIGYHRRNNQSFAYLYFEYNGAGTGFQQWAVDLSGYKRYMVTVNTTTGRAEGWLGQTKMAETSGAPLGGWTACPWRIAYKGETHDAGDDVAGTRSQPVSYTSLQFKNTNGVWGTPSQLALSSSSSRYGMKWITNQQAFDIWTK